MLTIAEFRALTAPDFLDDAAYPDETIQLYIDQSLIYVSEQNCGSIVDEQRRAMIYWLAAHLLKLGLGVKDGMLANASRDGVSIGFVIPQNLTVFKAWLSGTRFGGMLLVLLQSKATGGTWIGSGFSKGAVRDGRGRF